MTREERRASDKRYRKTHREERRAKNKLYWETHREEHRAYNKTRREEKHAYDKLYRETHGEEIRARSKLHYKTHPEKVRVYQKRHRQENPKVRLSNGISAGIRRSLKRGKQGCHWESLVGYTLAQLVAHLESLFQPGMSWDNCGDWHLDHVVPISAFNFSCAEDLDFRRCWALSNLQPLWAAENIRKSDKHEGAFQPCLQLKIPEEES